MNIQKEMQVLVESVECPENGLGEIVEIICNANEAVVRVLWPNGNKEDYLTTELEFIIKD